MRVAIIGAGLIGEKRAGVLNKIKDDKLVAIVDINLEKARALSSKYGGDVFQNWKQIIARKDIDALIVSTPNKFIAPISIAALENKKHVLCEKPMGRDIKEASKIYKTAKKSGVILKVGFNHRYHPAISKAKYLVERGEIGEIFIMRCRYGHGGRPGYDKEWRASKDISGGGELLDQGIHVVDLFRWFLGEFEEAFGYINTYYWNVKVEDNAIGFFKTKKGQIALMHVSWTQWKNLFSFEIYGSKGYLIIEGLGGTYGVETLKIGKRKTTANCESLIVNNKSQYAGGPPEEKVIVFDGPDISWEEEWKEFILAIKEGREPIGNGYDGLQANKMIGAIYKSARLNRPVKTL